jgi:RNA polymerase sigma-70 factor (ECF subfamily)
MRKKQNDSENLSSPEFIAKLKGRDRGAIELIVRSYTEQIYRACLGLGFDANGAQELTQSVWVTFFDVICNFQAKSHVRTFVFGILYNKASELRRDHAKVETSDAIEEIVDKRFSETGEWIKPPVNPEAFLGAAQTLSIIEKCLEQLPTAQRMAFTMKEVEEEETPEICNILGVTVTNLGVLLYRARNRLRECIEGKTKHQT